MAAGKKGPDEMKPSTPDTERSLRDGAEDQLAHSPKRSSGMEGQTPEQLIHELQVHQIELETQAEELRKSKLALEESRDKYLDLYEFAPLGYFTLSDKALITGVNLTGTVLLGVEGNDLVMAPFSKFIAETDADQWHRDFRHLLNTGEKLTCTLMIHRGDGSVFPARLESIRLTGLQDGAITVRVAVSDVHDIRDAEEALRVSEERFRLLLQYVPSVAVQGYSMDGTTQYWNEASEDLYGYTSQEAIGKNLVDLIIPPEMRADVRQACRAMAQSGQPIPASELSLMRKDGSRVAVFSSHAIVKRAGSGTELFCMDIDLTERKRAEEALRENELLFREVFNNANDAVFLLERTPDGPGTYLLVNDTAVRMLGYSREELLKMSPRDIVPVDIAKKIMPSVIKKLQNEGHATFESAHRRKDGSIYPIEVSAHTFHYKGKDVDLSIVRDITVRKRAEETVRQSEEKFRLVVENDPDAIFIQTEGQFAYVNPAACRLFGAKSADLLVGTPVLDRFHPDFREIVKERIHVLNDERQPVARIEEMYLRLDDTPFDVEVSAVPMTYLQKDGALIFFNDITERKVAEETVRQSEQKFRDIFEKSVTGLFKVTPDGSLIDVNGAFARLYDYSSAAEMLTDSKAGRRHYISRHLYANQEDRNEIHHILAAQGKVENYETQHIKRDGTCLWVSITARIILDAEGTVRYYEGSVSDITERKRAEEALRQANKKLTLLSSITRHDINNQLTVLRGYLAILEEEQPDPILNEYFCKVSTAAKRISAMIQFTKEYEGIGVTAPSWQDTRTLVDTAAKEGLLGKVMVKNDLPAGAEVFADPLIVKVFYNLVDNAARYGGKITTIRFSARESGDDHLLICEDDGDGVVAAEKEKIFERGFGKNTGLGLALSREILLITGITITETGGPGQGARFEITVPKGAWRMVGNGE